MTGNAGVMGRALGISVAEIVLHGAEIGPLVGEVIAAAVAEHARPDAPELRGLASDPHDIVDGLAGELCLPLGHKQPGQIVLPGGEAALDGAQLSTAIGCSTLRLPLRQATHSLDRLAAGQPAAITGDCFADDHVRQDGHATQ